MTRIEIKAARSPDPGQLDHLAWLRDHPDAAAPAVFRAGVRLQAGDQSGKVGVRFHLAPSIPSGPPDAAAERHGSRAGG